MLFASLLISGCVNCTGKENSETTDWKFTYPGGKLKAVTFSYDDGVIEDRELIKIFDRYNIKATFNISLGRAPKHPNRSIQAPEVKELYKKHEVASHGYLHRTMILLGDKSLEAEIADNQKAIAEVLGSEPPGFAYPYGRHTSKKAPTRIYEALAKHGLRYARTCQRKADFDLPSNWLAWSPNGHHNAGLAICKRYKEFKSDKMSVCYIWGHSYEFVRPKPRWEIIENICKLIANQPDIWYATNGEIALYVQACEAAKKASKFPEIVNPTDMELHLLVDGRPVILPPKSTKKFHRHLKKTTDGGVSRPISRLAALASRVTYVSMLPALLACKTRHCRTIHPPSGSFVF